MLRYRHQHKADDTKELKLGRSEKSAEWRAAALEQTLALTVRCLAWRDALIPTVVDDKFVLPELPANILQLAAGANDGDDDNDDDDDDEEEEEEEVEVVEEEEGEEDDEGEEDGDQ